jgi:uncharacterized protein YjbI with pentapeptide repeats
VQVDFVDCVFNDCNFSLTKFKGTGVKEVQFNRCKVVGVDFSACSDFLFSVNFDACQLDYSQFQGRKMKKTKFNVCSLKEVDFSEADLTESIFANSDLTRTTFQRTQLHKADFRTAINFSIHPEPNFMKKAKFSLDGLPGLLEKFDLVIEQKIS